MKAIVYAWAGIILLLAAPVATAQVTGSFSSDAMSLNEGGSPATLTVTLNQPAPNPNIFFCTSFSGVPTFKLEIIGLNGSGCKFFEQGSTTASFTVAFRDDPSDEPNATLTIAITSFTGATLTGNSSVALTLVDDDTSTTLQLSVDDDEIDENGNEIATITVNLAEPVNNPSSVCFTFTSNVGHLRFYQLLTNITAGRCVGIAAGESSASFQINGVQGVEDEVGDPILTVTIDNASSGPNFTDIGDPISITVLDDDLSSTISIASESRDTIDELNTVTSIVTAELATPVNNETTVCLHVSGIDGRRIFLNGATFGMDCEQITAGTTTATWTFSGNPSQESFNTGDTTFTYFINSVGPNITIVEPSSGTMTLLESSVPADPDAVVEIRSITEIPTPQRARVIEQVAVTNIGTGDFSGTLTMVRDVQLVAAETMCEALGGAMCAGGAGGAVAFDIFVPVGGEIVVDTCSNVVEWGDDFSFTATVTLDAGQEDSDPSNNTDSVDVERDVLFEDGFEETVRFNCGSAF